jgi:hypothetical protein
MVKSTIICSKITRFNHVMNFQILTIILPLLKKTLAKLSKNYNN